MIRHANTLDFILEAIMTTVSQGRQNCLSVDNLL